MSRSAPLSLALTFAVGLAGGVAGTFATLHQGARLSAGGGGGGAPIQVIAPGNPDGIAGLVEQVKAAVVNIDTEARRQVPVDPFEYFFGEGAPAPRTRVLKGVGSGFVVSPDGLIVTNNHVVQDANKLTVTFPDGKKLEGRLVGTDPATDIAVVRVNARALPKLELADPASLKVGQYVVAMGSPLGLSQSVSMGILSAVNRDIPINSRVGFLQTDAPINPGNSGGPLLDLHGKVIGVNTAIAASAQGIGFAVPVGTLQTVLPQLEKTGKVIHPWLGVRVTNLPDDRGVLVAGTEPGSPAARAGLQPGDVIKELNGKPLEDAGSLIRTVSAMPVGSKVALAVLRQGQPRTVSLTVDRMPD